MSNIDSAILKGLGDVPWETLARAYGNAHPTLIGSLTRWWLERAPGINWVLDGAPSYQENLGKADALLCDGNGPAGVVEVEGSEYKVKVRTIGSYFGTPRDELKGIHFGILVVYPIEPKGTGPSRRFPKPEDRSLLDLVSEITARHDGCQIIVVTVNKRYEPDLRGIRATRDYYMGAPSRIQGILFIAGREAGRQLYYSESGV